jgi:hypothetical protein
MPLHTFWIMRNTWHAEWWHDLPVCRGLKPCNSQWTKACAAAACCKNCTGCCTTAVHNETALQAYLVVGDGTRRQHCDVGACWQARHSNHSGLTSTVVEPQAAEPSKHMSPAVMQMATRRLQLLGPPPAHSEWV